MFFVDKYVPKNIEDVIFHKKEVSILKKMSQDESIPHIIFSGPEGVGKKTLINLFLRMVYDDQVNNLTDSIYNVSGSGNTSQDIIVKQSNYHIIIEPHNNNFDRYLIQDVVKEYAKKIPLHIFTNKKPFKMVLINNVDNLSYYAQTSLRRTMEKYSSTCRFIMWCKSLSRVIDPIRSRCYCFRIGAPADSDLIELLAHVSYKESINLTALDYINIIDLANGNIKKALWLLQLKQINEEYKTSYDEAIDDIVGKLLTRDINVVVDIRVSLYNIMITNIVGSQIIKDIIRNLFDRKDINETCKFYISDLAAKCEHNLIKGRREIIHLDPFIISIICILGKYNKKIENIKEK